MGNPNHSGSRKYSGTPGVLGIGESRVAVELNGKIIRRAEWEQMRLSDMDRVEIVQFVGGGNRSYS